MYIFRVCKCKYISDLSGFGAATHSGRWNSKGVYTLYASSTSSLALLENVVHMSVIPDEDYCLAKLKIPDTHILAIKIEDLPSNWSVYPAPDILKSVGDLFIKNNEYLALLIPSVVMPEENNVLLNPGHPDFRNVKIENTRKISIDVRLF